VEQRLEAELYVDEEFGPIMFQGILDHVGVDPDDDGLIHLTDYKTNRRPAAAEDVRGDAQLKGYNWLLIKNWAKYSDTGFPRIVTHLDLIKWSEVEAKFSLADIEAWESWAIAVVRKILRDTKGEPRVNAGCNWCPVKADCPAFQELPEIGMALIQNRPTDPDALAKWADEANRTRLLLENAVKEIDTQFKGTAMRDGEIRAGGWRWYREPNWVNRVDVKAAHRALGDSFYDIVKLSKAALERAVKGKDTHAKKAVLGTIERVADGEKISKEKLEESDV
jgi:hypothetical protein